MSDTSAAVGTTPAAPVRENVRRGTLAALLTVPAGVAAWVLIWGLGYVTAIVGALVAFVALRLYVWGAGRISRLGAVVVLLTTAVTLLLAFFAGIVYDGVVAFSEGSTLGAWGTLTHPDFWPLFFEVLPEAMPDYLPDFGWALGFGALGSFAVLRSAFAAANTQDVVEAVAPSISAPSIGVPTAAAPAAATAGSPDVTPEPTSEPTPEPTPEPTSEPQAAPGQV